MKCRPVPEKISDFLVRRQGRMYCDTCIQERLGLKWRQQVQLITATLAVTESFKREVGRCCTCGDAKQVIQALADFQNCVIATGGGTVLDPENVAVLKKLGKIFYLRVPKGAASQS